MKMSQKPRTKRSLVHSFHDRSTDTHNYKPKIQYATTEYVNKAILKIENLENEAIRFNKMLVAYIDRIEELELRINRLEKDNLIKNVLLKSNTVKPQLLTITDVPSSSSTSLSTESDFIKTTPENIRPRNIKGWERFTKIFKSRPSLETLKSKNIYKNEVCFDTELEKVLKHEQFPTIPKIMVECVRLIEIKIKNIPTTEGLYRISGNYAEIQKIRFDIDNNNYDCLKKINDIHNLVGVLKLFLREIKSPLVKLSEIRAFIGSDSEWKISNTTYKIEALKKLVKSLPEQNRDTLCYFFQHLYKLTNMTLQFVNSRSLALSLTPTIFHFTKCEKIDLNTTIKESELLTSCLQVFIEYHGLIFEQTMARDISEKLSRCISCLTGNKC